MPTQVTPPFVPKKGGIIALIARKNCYTNGLPRGTLFQFVINRGGRSVITVPNSDAHVSPFAQEIAPSVTSNKAYAIKKEL